MFLTKEPICVLFLLLQFAFTSCFQIHFRQPQYSKARFVGLAEVVSSKSYTPLDSKNGKLLAEDNDNDDEDSFNVDVDDDASSDNEEEEEDDDEYLADEDFEILFEESVKKEIAENLEPIEKAWRYAKKPLLSIGGKGATFTHGNSLKQLLESHTVVKVKVNTKQFGTLEKAFEDIRALCEESGAPKGIEMLQARDKDKIILFGMPGTLERLKQGDFPPPPPPPYVRPERQTEDEEE